MFCQWLDEDKWVHVEDTNENLFFVNSGYAVIGFSPIFEHVVRVVNYI